MAATTPRLRSIDIIRGAVMVLMALDHVRVFAGVPAGGPTPALFFTRWITNFCAPAFVFFAGSAAFLHGRKVSPTELSKYLAIRGALLILFEMTISRLSWTFNLDFYNYTEANVLWAIGWSMLVLAVLVRLPLRAIIAFAVIVVAGHNIIDGYRKPIGTAIRGTPFAHFFQVLYFGGEFRWFNTGPKLVVLYTLIPWIGVMAAGYLFGQVLVLEPVRRRRLCLAIGGGAALLFVVLRAFNLYGDPSPWGTGGELAAPLSFLATSKYPASLLFLLMTIGPVIALIPLLDSAAGWFSDVLDLFGRVPLFYYLIHIPVIHATTLLISLVRTPAATSWLFENHPLRVPPAPEGYIYPLPMLYAVTIAVVTFLYFPCRWYAALKARRRDRWLSYI